MSRLGPGRALALGFVTVLAILVPARAASAHAELVSSQPGDGAVVTQAPATLTLTFSESVETVLGAVRLFDSQGQPVAIGAPRHPAGHDDQVQVATSGLGQGTYLVSWRVTSADSHPVQGSFLFSVGQRSAVTADAGAVLAGRSGSRVVGALLGASRVTVFAGFALLAGGLAFVAIFGRTAPRMGSVLVGGAAALVVGSLASLALQGGYANGTSLGQSLHPAVWRLTARTDFGRQALWRVALGAVGAALALLATQTRRPWWWRAAALSLGPLAAATLAYAGHAHTGRWPRVGVTADVVHLVALAWWLGGLAVLAVTAVRAADGRDIVSRFSPVALGCVGAVVASGVVQSWRQVGSLDAFATTYGRLLLVKLALVAGLLGVALVSRRAVHRWTADLRPPSRLRRALLGELALGLGVLGVTAGLVATAPARDQVARPFSTSLLSRGATASLVLDPARAGAVVVHLYVTPPGGALAKAAEARLLLSLPTRGVTDLSLPMENTGPNHFSSQGARIPFRGRWQLTVLVRFGEFDSYTFTTAVNVR